MKPVCPKCDSDRVSPIIYGDPSDEMLTKAARKEVVLGGCMMRKNSPDFLCQDCGTRWTRRRTRKEMDRKSGLSKSEESEEKGKMSDPMGIQEIQP